MTSIIVQGDRIYARPDMVRSILCECVWGTLSSVSSVWGYKFVITVHVQLLPGRPCCHGNARVCLRDLTDPISFLCTFLCTFSITQFSILINLFNWGYEFETDDDLKCIFQTDVKYKPKEWNKLNSVLMILCTSFFHLLPYISNY